MVKIKWWSHANRNRGRPHSNRSRSHGLTEAMATEAARAVLPASELPPGARRVIDARELEVLVINSAGQLFAIENRCSHEDAALDDGELDEQACSIECRRHGSRFDLRTGRALNLPAYEPVETFDVVVEDGTVAVAAQ